MFFLIVTTSSCSIIVEDVFDHRNKFTGRYHVEEYSQTTNETFYYTVRIRKSWDYHDEVVIKNFYDAGIEVFAQVDGHKIFIPNQVIDGYEIEGVGTFSHHEISFSYSVVDLASRHYFVDYCHAVAIR